LSFYKDNLDVVSNRKTLSNTATRKIIKVEKLTLQLIDKVDAFYVQGLDKKYVESANLDSKILLHTKRESNSPEVRELNREKGKLDELIKPEQQNNREIIDGIVNILIEKKNTRRHFEIILGTLLLNYPVDKDDSKFDKRNEISKVLRPIYQCALISLLLEKLVSDGFSFKSAYLTDLLSPFRGVSKQEQETALLEFQKIMVEILYLKEMGYFSPMSLEILSRSGENNLLDQQNRENLRTQSIVNAKEFHHYGVGALSIPALKIDPIPAERDSKALSAEHKKAVAEKRDKKQQALVAKAERTAMMKQAARFAFIKDVMDTKFDEPSEIDELLKVCQVYTSFMLSVKGTVDKELNIKAYDIMNKQSNEGELNFKFADTLLAMMGRFPIGSGIYFMDLRRNANEFGSVDKAIVTGLNPANPDEPEVKRVTTKYKYKLDSGTVKVPKSINLYFEEARSAQWFNQRLQARFRTQFKNKDGDLLFSFRANDEFRTLAISETKLW